VTRGLQAAPFPLIMARRADLDGLAIQAMHAESDQRRHILIRCYERFNNILFGYVIIMHLGR
jgi:hypothetical protein